MVFSCFPGMGVGWAGCGEGVPGRHGESSVAEDVRGLVRFQDAGGTGAGFALQEVQDPAGDARGSAVEGWEGVGPRRLVRGMSGAEGGAESQPAVGEGQLRACAQVVGGVPQH